MKARTAEAARGSSLLVRRSRSRQAVSLTRIRIVVLLLELARRLSFVASASFGIAAELDVRARPRQPVRGAHRVLLLGLARLAWRGMPHAGPFDAAEARALVSLVTALGTFFAIALWAEYAPQATVTLSKTCALVLAGIGLILA